MQLKRKLPIIMVFVLCLIIISLDSIANPAIQQSDIEETHPLNNLIAIDFKNMPLEDAISTIAKESNMIINYNRDRLPKDELITLKKDHISAYDALAAILENSGMELNMTSGGQIAIVPDKNKKRVGILKGQVYDKETKHPLIGANIIIKNTVLGAATDMEGTFQITNVPVGSYTIDLGYIGYKPLIKTDVIIKSSRTTTLILELEESIINLEGITIKGSYFANLDEQSISAVGFSGEEVRRTPGSSGDISRVLRGLASVSKVNEQDNGLIVRGGNPIENGFFIDQIEIPNINHFPIQGSSGGPAGIINVDFIKDVHFSAGGFSSTYGDKLSSITNIEFREGNFDAFDAQFDLNMIGVGLTAEGPFANKKGSYLVSFRRSYLDMIAEASGLWAVPVYSDYQGKVVYNISPKQKLSLLALIGDDFISTDKKDAEKIGVPIYEKFNSVSSTAGLNLRSLWNENGYSNTTLSITSNNRNSDNWDYDTDELMMKNRSKEQTIAFRNVNYYRLNSFYKIECGFDTKLISDEYQNDFGAYTNTFGSNTSALLINKKISANKTGTFLNIIYHPLKNLKTITGIRYDRFSYNQNSNISPRFSFTYDFNIRTKLNGAAGYYYQDLPLVLISQNENFKSLKNPESNHVVLGLEHLLTENTRLTFELYQKKYAHLPVDPAEPSLLIMDELYQRYSYSNYFVHEQMLDKGKAYCRGLELVVQKKLATQIYGTMSFAWFKTRYQGLDGIWRDRTFDNEYIIGIDGGYKPNEKWEFSLRWNYAGGIPYTPLDLNQSAAINRSVYDGKQVNQARFPDTHSLNIRADRRFHFRTTNLILYYVIYNVYNRKNTIATIWNGAEKKADEIKLWGILPFLGVEYEF